MSASGRNATELNRPEANADRFKSRLRRRLQPPKEPFPSAEPSDSSEDLNLRGRRFNFRVHEAV